MFIDDGSQVLYDEEICWHCGHCSYVCPAQAITSEGGNIVINDSLCIACELCVQECPAHALKMNEE